MDGHTEAHDHDDRGLSAVHDKDGLLVPQIWHANIKRWESQPLGWRQKQSAAYIKDLAKPEPEPKAKRNSAPRFSTQYAIDWGRSKGWKLIDRERYDHRLKRHHDLLLGSDAMFETDSGVVLVQGAGKSEKAVHIDRFNERGGAPKATKLRMAFVYVEFVRGSKVPILEEWWVHPA